jgi:hypothetical protein
VGRVFTKYGQHYKGELIQRSFTSAVCCFARRGIIGLFTFFEELCFIITSFGIGQRLRWIISELWKRRHKRELNMVFVELLWRFFWARLLKSRSKF